MKYAVIIDGLIVVLCCTYEEALDLAAIHDGEIC